MLFARRTDEKIMPLPRRRGGTKDAAKDNVVPINRVQRVLKMGPFLKSQPLLEAVSFDEFKGSAGEERFQCIITNPLKSGLDLRAIKNFLTNCASATE